MSIKELGPGTVNEIDSWVGGSGWIAHPAEGMQRASHALVVEGEVWVVDPVDADGLDEFLSDLGTVAGVVVLLDRHQRDCGPVAKRHDVAVHVPRVMADIAPAFDTDTEIIDGTVPGTNYRLRTVVDSTLIPFEPFRWREVALYDEQSGTLVVPESLGAVPYTLTKDERLGVHPMRRFTPPRSLRGVEPDRVLLGHGEGIHEDPSGAIRDAVDGARRRAPSLYFGILREALSG